jgi:uncharacterized protein YdeI (YjbR/CyaY-like superfamily)
MKNRNPAFDAYIAKAQPFARPILSKIRDLFHQACPEIHEVLKWSHPSFDYHGIVGGMAAFKEHVNFGFWKQSLLKNPHGIFKNCGEGERTRLRSLADLAPDKVFIAAIKEAVALNAAGVKQQRPKSAPKPTLKAPEYFLAALRKKKGALAAYEAFSPSAKREYIEWLIDAKQEATREKRLATAIEWIAEGKHRNWKYEKGCVSK